MLFLVEYKWDEIMIGNELLNLNTTEYSAFFGDTSVNSISDESDMDVSLATVMLGTAIGDFVTQFGPLILCTMLTQGSSKLSNAISRWIPSPAPSLAVPCLVSLVNSASATKRPVVSELDFNNEDPLELAYQYYNRENFQEAFKLFKEAAFLGNEDAQYKLGMMCRKGEGVGKNDTEAFQWFKKAADQGYAEAQYELAVIYYNGEVIGRNYDKAFKWIEKSATQGYSKSKLVLGVMYYNGHGVSKNYSKALNYLTPFAEQGDKKAITVIDSIFSFGGYGVKKDLKKVGKYKSSLSDQENETGVTTTWRNALAFGVTTGLVAIGYKMFSGDAKPKDRANRIPIINKIKKERRKQKSLRTKTQ